MSPQNYDISCVIKGFCDNYTKDLILTQVKEGDKNSKMHE